MFHKNRCILKQNNKWLRSLNLGCGDATNDDDDDDDDDDEEEEEEEEEDDDDDDDDDDGGGNGRRLHKRKGSPRSIYSPANRIRVELGFQTFFE